MEDKVLVCKSCGQEWTWTAAEQEFFAEQGFENEPRCLPCRQAGKRSGTPVRQLFTITCESCGRFDLTPGLATP